MTSERIISDAANDVGDIGFEFLTKKEYLQFMNDSLKEIARECGAFSNERTYNLTKDSNILVLPVSDIIAINRMEYLRDTAVIPFREISFSRIHDRLHNLDGLENNFPGSGSSIIPFPDATDPIIISSAGNDNTNMVSLSTWYATKTNNGVLSIFFGFNAVEGDRVRMWVLSGWTEHATFDDTEIVWDDYADVVKEGVRWRALRRMQYRPNAQQRQLWEYRNEYQGGMVRYYRELLPKLKRYVWSLKTTQDELRIAPFNYL